MVDQAIDEDIDNEAILPVNAPKKLDFTKEMRDEENNKNKENKKTNVMNKPVTGKQKWILPKVESSSTDMPKSPSGKLVISRHRLKKTLVKIISQKKVCCTVCRKAFEGKDMLRDHYKKEHTSSLYMLHVVCNKTFATKWSLRKHSYTHLEKQISYADCEEKFSFKSELEVHWIKC